MRCRSFYHPYLQLPLALGSFFTDFYSLFSCQTGIHICLRTEIIYFDESMQGLQLLQPALTDGSATWGALEMSCEHDIDNIKLMQTFHWTDAYLNSQLLRPTLSFNSYSVSGHLINVSLILAILLVGFLVSTNSWGKYLSFKQLNVSLCSPASGLTSVWCWAGNVQRALREFSLKIAVCCGWKTMLRERWELQTWGLHNQKIL